MKTLISNARIWLGRNYYASHIGFDDESGKIEFVGNSDSLSKCKIDFDEILNLPDKLVIPAFHDGHCHLLAGAILNSHLDLRAASTIKDFTDSIKIIPVKIPANGRAADTFRIQISLNTFHLDWISSTVSKAKNLYLSRDSTCTQLS